MKYQRLTKEQFEELHPEFINFLATQSITGDEWNKIKQEQPLVAEQELDVFSDLIWEGVLSKATHLQNISTQQLFLFELSEEKMNLIALKITDTSKDLTTTDGFQWLQENIESDEVELFTAAKSYSEDKNLDVFNLIKQGAEIVEPSLFLSLKDYIS